LQHVALAIGEELDQQNVLLESLDEDVGTTQQRLSAAQKRIKHVLRDRGSWQWSCAVFGLLALLVVIIGLAWRLF